MMKKQTLWIILFPVFIFAQSVETKNGALIIDFKSKERKEKEKREFVKPGEEVKPSLFEEEKPESPEEEPVDLDKESLFKGLFSAGLNLSQVDGDAEFGYKKVGGYFGVGTLVKFHKNFSVSLEMIYSMRGARPKYRTYDSLGLEYQNKFDITYDYLDIPISLNVHDKKFVIFGVGLNLGTMVRYKQTDARGEDITNNATRNVMPRKLDLAFQTSLAFMIKRQFGIGVKFQYTMLSLRPAVDLTNPKIKGQYNNMITVRFTYLLDPKLMKFLKRNKK